MLREQQPEAIGIRELAVQAGVPTGTLYQFFADKDAVFQALAIRFLAGMPTVLDDALGTPDDDWPTTVDRIIDGYAEMIREHPAIRQLWLSGALDAATQQLERATDATIAARIGTAITTQAGSSGGSAVQWQTLVALIHGLLRHAFADEPKGDAEALRETQLAARAYVTTVLAP